ncbi:hypothetical protein BDF22DRAFT_734028 [Syncephalis plumigaleata]|nr:hypothetical protein BDF22DRAFT_734028 [Syncephalis plumigaleata]
MEDSPVAKVHELAQAAETHLQRGQMTRALALYTELLERVPETMEHIEDPQVVDTLSMMQKTYERAVNDIQRRLKREERQGVQQLSANTQATSTGTVVTPPSSSSSSSSSSSRSNRGARFSSGPPSTTGTLANSYASLNQAKLRCTMSSVHAIPPRPLNRTTSAKSGLSQSTASLPAVNPPAPLPNLGSSNSVTMLESPSNRNYDHSGMSSIAESTTERTTSSWDGASSSYMIIPGRNMKTDPFEKFWEAVESLMDRISNPVALSTVPLYNSEYTENLRQDLASAQELLHHQPSMMYGSIPTNNESDPMTQQSRIEDGVISNAAAMEELARTPSHLDSPSEEIATEIADASVQRTMSDSFYLVDRPSNNSNDCDYTAGSSTNHTVINTSSAGHNSALISDAMSDMTPQFSAMRIKSTKSIEEYEMENKQLKQMVDMLSDRVATLEKSAEEHTALRNNLDQFRDDIRKRAQRLLQSQELVKSTLMQCSTTAGEPSVPQLQARIHELEEEVRRISAEKEKQMATIIKFKQNWQRLKESSKRNQVTPSKLDTAVETTDNATTSESHTGSMSYARAASSTSV